jgi:hypothetical protein
VQTGRVSDTMQAACLTAWLLQLLLHACVALFRSLVKPRLQDCAQNATIALLLMLLSGSFQSTCMQGLGVIACLVLLECYNVFHLHKRFYLPSNPA